jgi:hypothetical protein
MDKNVEEAWFEFDETEREKLEELFNQIRNRCRAAEIPFEDVPGEEGDGPALTVKIASGRSTRPVLIDDSEAAEALLAIPFEKYRFVPGYDAVYVQESGEVEVAVRSLGSSTPYGVNLSALTKIMGKRTDSSRSRTRSLNLSSPDNDPHGTSITIQAYGTVLSAFLVRTVRLSLIIRRPGLDTAEKAERAFVKLSDALFFQIEHLGNIALGLTRERAALPQPSTEGSANLRESLQYPAMEYDKAPISLYWYGRNAVGMPLLQFLAYYQVLEYYYPVYSKAEATRRLQRALKEPGFRADRDADVSRLLNVIQDVRSGGFFDERSQLKATLTECLDATSLTEYLTLTPERKTWFGKKNDALGTRAMPFSDQRMDVVNEVAERIYQIRCKIVHPKAEGGGGEVELLLPHSKEAEMLSLDIELVRYVSQRVLISASTRFQLN